jgi:hypothetical protein
MLLTPVLPALAIANSAWQVLDIVSAGLAGTANVSRPTWTADVTGPIAGSTRSSNVSGTIARAAWPANVGRPIAWCARPADVTGSIAWLPGPTDIARPTAAWLARAAEVGAATAGSSRQLGSDVAGAWPATAARQLAGTIAEKLCGSTACERTARTGNRTGSKSGTRSAGTG